MSGKTRITSAGRRAIRFTSGAVGAVLMSALFTGLGTAPSSAAGDPCGAGGNKIACENSKPGTPQSQWDIDGAGDADIQGFATDISVNVGKKIDFKIDTNARAYTIDIYRTGYYGGNGARKIASVSPSATLPQSQPQCITDQATYLYDCGNWAVSASWTVPADAVSGVYIAKLTRTDNSDSSHITFIVRDDSSHSDVVFQTSDPTWHAYNSYGGSDFYAGGGNNGRAYKISYNRPFNTRNGVTARDFYMSSEYAMVRFMEKNGYDVSYISGVDSDRNGALIKNHKIFMSVGHDEYVSKGSRANIEAARDAGVNLMYLSGNEVYWKTRYEASADSSHTDNRTLVSYKETWSNAKIDPSPEWTGTWRDPRFAPKDKGGGMPENGLTGTIFMSNYTDLPVTVSAAEGKLRLWRNTGLQSMSSGQTAALAPHTVGYESDEDLDNGSRPQGLIRLSTVSGAVTERLLDYGSTTGAGTTTHHLTMYKAPSGALVFSAGSIQWTWGLDATHDGNGAAADKRMQQAQVNLFADMGAQPTTLDSTLVAATKSTDTTAPSVAITTPAANATIANGTSITATGTASDTGGTVAGVEVSQDNGTTWHPATGTTSWSYTYIQHGNGSTALKVRAIDDSANIGTAVSRPLTVTCPCNIFGTEVPLLPAANDPDNVELGLRFSPQSDGFVTGVRFYKGTGNTGTHVGSLWSTSGQRLATVTFSGESATGWQTASFASPVAVSTGVTYVVSYTAPNGHYAAATDVFSSLGIDAAPLSVDGGFGASPAGVYANGGQYPGLSYKSSNYYVDPMFTSSDSSPLTITNQWPLAGSSSVPADTTVKATFSKPVVTGMATLALKDANGATVAGSSSYDATSRTITFTPSAPLNGFVQYTATAGGTDSQGQQVTTGKIWSFTTAKPTPAPGVCPCSIFNDSTVPTVLEDTDPAAVTVGVRFASDTAGSITGVKFYKGPNNTGSHTGTLWSATGTKLAEGTFTAESTTGWQTLTFSSPVAIAKDTEYIASYRTTVGKYSVIPGGFSSDVPGSPLRTPSSGGSYTYGSGFPDARSSANYMVDVVFTRPAPQIAITAQDPPSGAVDVSRSTSISVWFTDTIAPGATMSVKQGSTTIDGTTTLSPDATRLTFKPSATLPKDAVITVTLSGVTSTSGANLGTQTWSFHTTAVDDQGQPQSLFSDQIPTTLAAADDPAAVELGMSLTPAKDGTINAIRFYKGTGNIGTHVGHLWSASGQLLATTQFANETPSGWQTASLSQPVAVTAGTSYVVSYLAPQGHYSYTSGFFNSPLTNGDLSAPASTNGRYLYGAAGGYPIYTYNATNYFVDVVFLDGSGTPPPPPPPPATITVASQAPAPGATGVTVTTKPSITFSAAIASGYSVQVKAGTTTIAGTTALSADAKTLTFTPAASLPNSADISVTISGVVSTAGASLPTQTWTFRTVDPVSTNTSLFTGVTPTDTSQADSFKREFGMVFQPSATGKVTAIRFYKDNLATGAHVGSIWSSTGTKLASVTFTNETGSGWQTATLATPLALTSGTTYVVSYSTTNGRHVESTNYFTSARTVGVLSAPASGNGRYRNFSSGYPSSTAPSKTNYFVDIVFNTLS